MELVLKREYFPEGTNGTLYFSKRRICHSIELPWRENHVGISCIPEGIYRLEKRYSQRFHWHLALKDVKNRSYILIHPANHAQRELRGCIAPVLKLSGAGLGMQSRIALQKLTKLVFPVLERGEVVCLNINT